MARDKVMIHQWYTEKKYSLDLSVLIFVSNSFVLVLRFRFCSHHWFAISL